ncbi:MAG: thioredoxin domain-containing protein [Woeseiaceae bacterium]|nr:thioredoxin domain-containing protein [Woeseiaceae bacterium]
MTPANRQNRLAAESSPYLLQHADNPVDWHPWDDEALALARKTDKPILLSVGYSACHWCHVMAHESFEDDATAELMNRLFINIKVDREERPDLDKIYQLAHQLLTQRPGGWPLTMFINPADQRPFFGGTYFPKDARYGMPAFVELLQRVAEYYAEHRDEVQRQGQQLQDIFTRLVPQGSDAAVLNAAPIAGGRQRIGGQFDREYGGVGGAPKFPHPATLDRLLRHWRARASGDDADVEALFMVSLTLTRMAEGGIYDHLGGGFCRYAVDRGWQIPHFEKMLYDNGPLLALYAQAALATGEPLFERVANETADWLLTDMRSPEGGFYAARDADSEGEEGRYYAWTPNDVRAVLEPRQYEVFARRFGLDTEANFEHRWHLTVHESVDDIARSLPASADEVRSLIDDARKRLLAVRQARVAPARDEKQLTAWNGLAIRGLAIAGRTLQRPDLIDAAHGAADFVRTHLVQDERLLASYKDGSARFPAYLDDHAFMLDALLEVLQSHWHGDHLRFAISLAELLLDHFLDADEGGFWFTADDHEALMHRPKPLADEAVPSGAGIAAFSLQRLGFLLGEARYLDAAERTLGNAWQAIEQHPHAHVSLLTALEEYVGHPEIIIIRGPYDEASRWRDAASRLYAPRRLVFAIPADEASLPGALAERAARPGHTIAYRCTGSQCSLPFDTFDDLTAVLTEITEKR